MVVMSRVKAMAGVSSCSRADPGSPSRHEGPRPSANANAAISLSRTQIRVLYSPSVMSGTTSGLRMVPGGASAMYCRNAGPSRSSPGG